MSGDGKRVLEKAMAPVFLGADVPGGGCVGYTTVKPRIVCIMRTISRTGRPFITSVRSSGTSRPNRVFLVATVKPNNQIKNNVSRMPEATRGGKRYTPHLVSRLPSLILQKSCLFVINILCVALQVAMNKIKI